MWRIDSIYYSTFGTVLTFLALTVLSESKVDPYQLSKPSMDPSIPEFNVSLDEPPETRWNNVVKAYKSDIPILSAVLKKLLPSWGLKIVEYFGNRLDSHFSPEFAAELRAVAKATGVPVGDFVLINLMYELNTELIACTTIIAQNSNRTVYFARNLDYNFAKTLRNLSITVNFQRSGKTVASMITQPGFIGALTGIKWNSFVIDLNQRDSGMLGNLITMLRSGNFDSAGMRIRKILENPQLDFKGASRELQTMPFISGAYISISGVNPGEGMVITRSRSKPVNVWPINVPNGEWFVLETNYDHWKPAGDKRRATGMAGMKKIGPGFKPADLFDVLSIHPVLNHQTVYTTVIDPRDPSVMRQYTKIRSNPQTP